MSVIAIFFVGYGFVALFFIRPLAGHIAYAAPNHGKPDWAWGYFGAAVLSVFWPAVFVSFVVGQIGPPVGAERKAHLAEQDERIRDLERALEVAER